MKTKLTKNEVFKSVLTFIISYIALMLVMLLVITINLIDNDDNITVAEFITVNSKDLITVCVSMAFLTIITFVYFFFENKSVLARYSKIIEIYLAMGIALLSCNVFGKFVSPTARPLLFLSLMVAMVLRRKDAIFINSEFALVIFLVNRFLNGTDIAGGSIPIYESVASLLTIFFVGTVGIFLLKNIKTRLGCVVVALILCVPSIIINIVMQLSQHVDTLGSRLLETVLFSALGCIVSVLLFMVFLPVFEALFSELTPFRLRELTSDSNKLMKNLKLNAPGTYNHSIVVAQLAEACASAIGEDSELARAAAYYHDVGKLKNPEMFAENQNEYDLHKELTPELSVDIIRSHAKDGAKLIKKHHLPEFFADVAVQHHGTLPIKYFYAKALKLSDGELNAANYSYTGPTPTTKIAAIIMIADASEAAARSLPERTPENVEALVSSIVEERVNLDQFADCDITLRELTVVTRTVVNELTGVYHSRVQYPKLVLSKKGKN